MKRRTFCKLIAGSGLLGGMSNRPTFADDGSVAAAVKNCLTIIRNCQLKDGAFRTKADGDPIWIQPYCVNHAALALLAGKEKTDHARVLKWLNWYVDHQRPDGTIDDFEGRLSTGYQSNGIRDSVDSYAAMYLVLIERYRQAAGNVPPRLKESARKALTAIQSVTDEDGLTWAKPDYHVKYLMDNLEVYGGLIAGEKLFRAVGDKKSADTALKMRQKMAQRLPEYWREDSKLFAFALNDRGQYEVKPAKEENRRESEGLGNLFALAWLSVHDTAPWTHVNQEFQPDGGNSPQAPVERWYIAATRIDPTQSEKLEEWKSRTVTEALSFTQNNVYLLRPAVTALALLEGAAWLPNLAEGDGVDESLKK